MKGHKDAELELLFQEERLRELGLSMLGKRRFRGVSSAGRQ